ncbi:MAG: hypothetical protein FWE01_02685 [Firmicutes bacterium]|nr:hypothetical protein [Bacillota bacterium]
MIGMMNASNPKLQEALEKVKSIYSEGDEIVVRLYGTPNSWHTQYLFHGSPYRVYGIDASKRGHLRGNFHLINMFLNEDAGNYVEFDVFKRTRITTKTESE